MNETETAQPREGFREQNRERSNRRQWLAEFAAAINKRTEYYGDDFADSLSEKLSRCHSRSKHAFTKWCCLQLERSSLDITVPEFLKAIYSTRAPVNPDLRDFKCVVNGKVMLVDLSKFGVDAVWKLPNTPEALAFAQEHWSSLSVEERFAAKEFAETIGQVGPQPKLRFRFWLAKKVPGGRIPLHQLWLPVEVGDHVLAADGDFLNWTTTTRKIVTTPKATMPDGTSWVTGKLARAGYRTVEAIETPNLHIASSDDNPSKAARQQRFEQSAMRRFHINDHGEELVQDRNDKCRVNENVGWRAGAYGRVVTVGKHRPPSREELRASGLPEDDFISFDPATPPTDDAAVAPAWNHRQPSVDEQARRLARAWGL